MTEIAPLWGIKVAIDAVANGFIVSCVSHGNSEIASMGNCIEPTFDEALLTAIAYYNAYLPDGLKMVAPAPFPLDPCLGCGGYHHVLEPCEFGEENTMTKEERIARLEILLEEAEERKKAIDLNDHLSFMRINRDIKETLKQMASELWELENEG